MLYAEKIFSGVQVIKCGLHPGVAPEYIFMHKGGFAFQGGYLLGTVQERLDLLVDGGVGGLPEGDREAGVGVVSGGGCGEEGSEVFIGGGVPRRDRGWYSVIGRWARGRSGRTGVRSRP